MVKQVEACILKKMHHVPMALKMGRKGNKLKKFNDADVDEYAGVTRLFTYTGTSSLNTMCGSHTKFKTL